MRGFQAVGRVTPIVILAAFLMAPLVCLAEEPSLFDSALQTASSENTFAESDPEAGQLAKERSEQADLFHETSLDTSEITAYGYDFYQSRKQSRAMRLRGGISGLSSKAAAGVQMIVTW